jgi:rhodanese-related sulfurtransferase
VGEVKMSLILIAASVAAFTVTMAIRIKRKRDRNWHQIEQHSITADALYQLLGSNRELLLFDVRQPLDVLADSEIVPGAKRIPPKEVLENPWLIPKEKDSVVYCTCPSDKTSRRILQQALTMGFLRIKFLKGGLAAWKASGYPVQPYELPFHLDTTA